MSNSEWMDQKKKKKWYRHTIDYHSIKEKEQIFPYATAWMKLEDILPSEITESQKDKYCWFHLYELSKKVKVKLLEKTSSMMFFRN